jgi:hypothetical protein
VAKEFIPRYTDYYYSSFLEEIYVGNTLKWVALLKLLRVI